MPELGSAAKWDEGERSRGSASTISMCKGPVGGETRGSGRCVQGELKSSLAKDAVAEPWALGMSAICGLGQSFGRGSKHHHHGDWHQSRHHQESVLGELSPPYLSPPVPHPTPINSGSRGTLLQMRMSMSAGPHIGLPSPVSWGDWCHCCPLTGHLICPIPLPPGDADPTSLLPPLFRLVPPGHPAQDPPCLDLMLLINAHPCSRIPRSPACASYHLHCPQGPPVTTLDSFWTPRVSDLSSTPLPISRQLRVAPNSPASLSTCPQEGKSRCEVRLCPRLNVGDLPGSMPQFPHLKHGGENQISKSHPLPPLAQPENSSTAAFPSPSQMLGFWAA